jgi:hypothetical protein
MRLLMEILFCSAIALVGSVAIALMALTEIGLLRWG